MGWAEDAIAVRSAGVRMAGCPCISNRPQPSEFVTLGTRIVMTGHLARHMLTKIAGPTKP
jgi:hypothetical protein